ncbi:MAG: hypothetical protein E7C76_20195, partial [Pseudomonas aeruginosa]|nr:hypothetical protein [Pseudomonas aeruginosa]
MKKLPLLLAASILAGCGTQQSTSNASFDGEVFYRERIAASTLYNPKHNSLSSTASYDTATHVFAMIHPS